MSSMRASKAYAGRVLLGTHGNVDTVISHRAIKDKRGIHVWESERYEHHRPCSIGGPPKPSTVTQHKVGI